MKVFHCEDAGFDCAGIIRVPHENEVLYLVARHAEQVHQVTVTPERAEQIKSLIRQEA